MPGAGEVGQAVPTAASYVCKIDIARHRGARSSSSSDATLLAARSSAHDARRIGPTLKTIATPAAGVCSAALLQAKIRSAPFSELIASFCPYVRARPWLGLGCERHICDASVT
jgi:hypothetical protein